MATKMDLSNSPVPNNSELSREEAKDRLYCHLARLQELYIPPSTSLYRHKAKGRTEDQKSRKLRFDETSMRVVLRSLRVSKLECSPLVISANDSHSKIFRGQTCFALL